LADPLADALALQRDAAAEGFDWTDQAGLWDKLAEEIGELRAAATPEHRTDEFGDLLFMALNLARHLAIDPADALVQANAKFRRRFEFIQRHRADLPALGDPARLQRMEELWRQAKALERNQ
jgi:uncharacterized protein YabN with tetrapyrrole methylase and pyrophosphatase domain